MLRYKPSSTHLIFVASVLIGIILYLPFFKLSSPFAQLRVGIDQHALYEKWMSTKNVSSVTSLNATTPANTKVVLEADYLKKEVGIVCAVIVKNAEKSFPEAISTTWGPRCSKTVYFTNKKLKTLSPQDQVLLKSSKTTESWAALREIARYLHTNDDLKAFQWFYFVSDQTYVVVENLRYYLSVRKSQEAFYLGHLMRSVLVYYNPLGPGFVLSQMALRKLNNAILKGQCSGDHLAGDIALGSCLSELGVVATDTRDRSGRGRFLMYPPGTLLVPGLLNVAQQYWDNSVYPVPEGPNCCSDDAISFYNMDVNKIHVMEYLVSHLGPYHND